MKSARLVIKQMARGLSSICYRSPNPPIRMVDRAKHLMRHHRQLHTGKKTLQQRQEYLRLFDANINRRFYKYIRP